MDQGTFDSAVTRLQELLGRLGSRRNLPHAVVAVERCDGSFRWTGAVGHANPDGTPMREDTPFNVASVTKLWIATIVMKLRERGRLTLDDPITAHLPAELVGGLHRLDGTDHTDAITVRNLLAHTSGLPDCLEERPRGRPTVIERLAREGDREWPIEDLLAIARQLRPHFPPQGPEARRVRARYSDTNFQLLIALIERVSGRPFPDAVEELLSRPLALRHTFHPARAPLDASTVPATIWFRDRPLIIPKALASVGDLYSTVGDTSTFLRALLDGRVFEDPASWDEMRRGWIRFGLPRDRAALRSPSWPIEYGLGTMRFRFPFPRVRTPGGTQPTLIGHTGSTGSWLFHCPELDLVLSGTVDQVTAGAVPYRFVPKVLRVFAARSR
jgi:D-alanyl-D-alanine carboxypeptidase